MTQVLLGAIADVKGASATVALSENTLSGLVMVRGRAYRIGQIGSFIRLSMGYVNVYGVVSQVGAGAAPGNDTEDSSHGFRWMTVQLIGESVGSGVFQRGVSQYPTIGDPVYLVVEEDLQRLYGKPESPSYVPVGVLASTESIPALVDINKLVTRHSAVVGSTGSGKSTTVAGLLYALANSTDYPSARVIVLDIHGEYSKALGDKATVFRIGKAQSAQDRQLQIPYWALTFEELLPLTFGDLEGDERAAVLDRILRLKRAGLAKKPRAGITVDSLTVDSPIPFSIHQLWLELHKEVNATHTVAGTGQSPATEALEVENGVPIQAGDALSVVAPRYQPQNLASGFTKIYLSGSPLNLRRQLEALASKLRDSRFDFFFRPGPWATDAEGTPQEDLDSFVSAWLGGPTPVVILDLSAVPYSVLTQLIGALLRIMYDALFWSRDFSEGGRERPLLVVLEEAHSYLNSDRFGPGAESVRRIVKEGRKYGIGAMIVSQRPAEIDQTILSQCGTLFALRLSNAADRSHVIGAAPDNLEGLFNMLPALRTGEAIAVGEAVNLPMRILIARPPPDRRPDSDDPNVYEALGPGGWNRGKEASNYPEVIEAWRGQDRRSRSLLIE